MLKNVLIPHTFSKKQKIYTAILLLIISLIWQCISLNAEGRTWDEEYKVDMGYEAFQNLGRGDFSFAAWNDGTEHPMIAKYFYAFAALPNITIIQKNQPLDPVTQAYLQTGKYYVGSRGNTYMVVNYDYTVPRIFSAVCNALTVAFVFLIASIFLPSLYSIFASFVLLTTPRFIAMGRLITFESLSDAFYVITILLFGFFLARKQQSTWWYIVIGVLSGLLLWTRYNNIYILLMLGGWWILWHFFHNKSPSIKKLLFTKSLYRWQLILIPLVTIAVGFATWPLMWIDFPKNFIHTFSQNTYRVSPFSFYYPIYLLYTTPVPYLILCMVGIGYAIKRHIYYLMILLWGFFSMLLFYMIFTAEGGGTRYIFCIYIPYALLTGIGLYAVIKWIGIKVKQVSRDTLLFIIGGTLLLSVLVFSVIPIHPYYLDYYNILAGGLPGAVQKNLSVSWWGEGQREAGFWLDQHAPAKSTVALKVTPKYVFPPLNRSITVYDYDTHIGDSDFLVVSRGDLPSVQKILMRYKKVYGVTREGVDLVTVFKKI